MRYFRAVVKDRHRAQIEVVADFVMPAQGLSHAKAVVRSAFPLALEIDVVPVGLERRKSRETVIQPELPL